MRKRLATLLIALLAPLVFALPAQASVDDFIISDYDINYTLQKDSENRSVLKTTETITAEFPGFDQNHGIERAIPQSYDGHTVNLNIDSVQKEDGSDWNYSTYESEDNLVVRIGDADQYVHGQQTYVISYTQRDVTRYFPDTNDDEFYWDTNGTGWRVPISHLNVSLSMTPGLQERLNGNTACYVGMSGSTTACTVAEEGGRLFAEAQNLSAGENVTLAVGFTPDTFSQYTPSLWEKLFGYLVIVWIVSSIVVLGGLLWIALRWSSIVNRTKQIGTVIPEYVPPKDMSVTAAASVLQMPKAVFAAQLLDFAVRHYLKLYEIEKTGFLWFKSKDYELEITKDISSLRQEEQEILKDIFGGSTAVGAKLKLSKLKNNTSVYKRIQDNDTKLKKLVRGEYGLREKSVLWSSRFKKLALFLVIFGVLTLNFFVIIAAAVVFGLSFAVWTLTDKGLGLSRYLQGLQLYIKVAEVERIKMLQSPDGAATVGGVDPDNKKQLVKLYEKVLPYAVLFGQEKEWNKQIGKLYEDVGQNPDWYSGRTAFTAATFSTAMSGLSSAASYSAASSSSSGGSSGGGSSGGGGGGGGGGGW